MTATAQAEVLARLVSARARQAPEPLLRWYGPDRLRANLERHLAEEVERLSSARLAKLFAYHCPVSGALPDDYRTRWLGLPGFGEALVGIRFRGLDMARPFVTVVASTRLPQSQGELGHALGLLGEEFSVFAPRHLRLFLPAGSELQPDGVGQFWEKRLLVGRVGELRAAPAPAHYERVSLQRANGTTWYGDYRNAFYELVAARPEYLEYTRLEAEEDLAELVEAGLLFEILVDGHWAGITAVDRDGTEGAHGYLMIEILLARHARGQGLGTVVLRRLAEQLPDPAELLVGTIDARNAAAVGAARRSGRLDVGGYLWAPFAGHEDDG